MLGDPAPSKPSKPSQPSSIAEVDALLTAQIAVAWAGEGHLSDQPRLGWWRSDLVSEYGGQDLLKQLLPKTFRWATLQAVREVAIRRDAEMRGGAKNPDKLVSLFHLGFRVDERVGERLMELKRGGLPPEEALPDLREFLALDDPDAPWEPDRFTAWVKSHGKVEHTLEPIGRRLVGTMPETLLERVQRLVAALAPLGESYPLPYFQGAR